MNLIFCKLKKLKKHEFNFLQAFWKIDSSKSVLLKIIAFYHRSWNRDQNWNCFKEAYYVVKRNLLKRNCECEIKTSRKRHIFFSVSLVLYHLVKNNRQKLDFWSYLTSHIFCPEFKIFCLHVKEDMLIGW